MKTLILAGGSGTRLFPLSREHYPKQFIEIFPGESLFQKTVQRARIFSEPDEIYVITSQHHRFLVRDQLSQLDIEAGIITEPCGKNTLPAIYYGLKVIEEGHGACEVAVLPSDHLIATGEEYRQAFTTAAKLARDNLVVFGIEATSPHTGYGYIKPGAPTADGGFFVEAFREKPDPETAQQYYREKYLWNSGMFLFSSGVFFSECASLVPELVQAFEAPVEDAYAAAPSLSIDYGIMEKTKKAAVVPLNAEWSDVGNFDALYDVFVKNGDNNSVRGEYLGIDSKNNLIIGDQLVLTSGVENMAVIATDDVVLVASRDHAQDVGTLVKSLRARGDPRTEFHSTVHRPWGCFTNLESGEFYKIKRVSVPPGRRLSLQLHHHRSEHWVVVKGTALVTIGEKEYLLKNGQSTYVPAGTVHRLANPGLLPLEIIEVQIGEYTGEDDIVRFEDDWDREKGE